MPSPAVELKDILVAYDGGSIGTFGATTGWSVHVGREAIRPDTVITLYDTGGLAPNPKWLLDYPSVQVRVRGAKGAYLAARAKIETIRDVLLGIQSQTLATGTRLVSITGLGDIASLGQDDNERPLFTVNFRLITHPATNAVTNRDEL